MASESSRRKRKPYNQPEPRLKSAMHKFPLFVTVLFLVLSASSLTHVHAQTEYYIPVYTQLGVASGRVGVVIPADPKWAHDAVLDALGIWNQAQVWFKETYFPTGQTYDFTESSTGIQVQYLYGVCGGCGSMRLNYTSQALFVQVGITDENKNTNSPLTVTTTAEHELGHALGLKHTEVEGDLMYPVGTANLLYVPSTLDLYALHVLATGLNVKNVIVLPSDIPYMTPPEEALPEFPNPIVLLAVFIGVSLMLGTGRPRRPQSRGPAQPR
jgi:hypothetical protein